MKDVNDEKNQQYSVITIVIREICIMFTANSK